MALVKFGGGVVQMAGKIAGNVFARNRYGNVVRGWTPPLNPMSTLQGEIRATAGMVQELWNQTLTPVQRAGWAQYADNVPMTNRFGEVMNLSGFNMFARTNAARLYHDMDAVIDAPSIFSLAGTDPTLSITPQPGTNQVEVVFDDDLDWVSEDGAAMLLYEGAPQNPGVNFFAGPWKRLGKIGGSGTTPPTSSVLLNSSYELTAGQRQWLRARIVRADGRLSGFFRTDSLISS